MASQNGHVEVVDRLLQYGATVDLQRKVRMALVLSSMHDFQLGFFDLIFYLLAIILCIFRTLFKSVKMTNMRRIDH